MSSLEAGGVGKESEENLFTSLWFRWGNVREWVCTLHCSSVCWLKRKSFKVLSFYHEARPTNLQKIPNLMFQKCANFAFCWFLKCYRSPWDHQTYKFQLSNTLKTMTLSARWWWEYVNRQQTGRCTDKSFWIARYNKRRRYIKFMRALATPRVTHFLL